mmetsp:Transcript_17852/g.34790  ORF Transcript_17852/g.34790 Transcript_17852/m.34790 type:complete len:104 (+) Transcript_17852:374-685(+)
MAMDLNPRATEFIPGVQWQAGAHTEELAAIDEKRTLIQWRIKERGKDKEPVETKEPQIVDGKDNGNEDCQRYRHDCWLCHGEIAARVQIECPRQGPACIAGPH